MGKGVRHSVSGEDRCPVRGDGPVHSLLGVPAGDTVHMRTGPGRVKCPAWSIWCSLPAALLDMWQVPSRPLGQDAGLRWIAGWVWSHISSLFS